MSPSHSLLVPASLEDSYLVPVPVHSGTVHKVRSLDHRTQGRARRGLELRLHVHFLFVRLDATRVVVVAIQLVVPTLPLAHRLHFN